MPEPTIQGFRCSPQQRHLWLQQQGTDDARWRTNCVVELKGLLDVDALRASIVDVVRRHEILRTVFHRLPASPIPVQEVVQTSETPWQVHRVIGASAVHRADVVDRMLQELAEAPFEPTVGAQAQFALVTFADTEHTLLISQPGLCADAASAAILAKEIARAYGVRRGEPLEASEPLQYADLAEWLNQQLEATPPGAPAGVDSSAAFTNRLPCEHDPAPDADFAPARVSTAVSDDLAAAVRQLTAHTTVGAGVAYLTVWSVLLGRLLGTNRVAVGVGCPGRDYDGLDQALGLFERSLPLALELRARPVEELLGDTQRAMDTASKHHEVYDPTQLGAAPDAFPRLAFVHLDPVDVHNAAGVRFQVQRREPHHGRFVARLVVDESSGDPVLHLEHDQNLLPRATAMRMLMQYVTLLHDACHHPELPPAKLAMQDAAERRLVVEAFGRGAENQPTHQRIHDVIAAQTEQWPSHTAVEVGDDSLTYAELDRRANLLALHLRDQGVHPGRIAGIYLDRSVEMIVAILAVLKAGGAYLPLAPGYPRERIEFMLEDAGAQVLLTRAALANDVASPSIPTLCLDRDRDELAKPGLDATPIHESAGPDDVAYVIYTSGSTGRPKGVPITHRNLVHSTCARLAYYQHQVETFLLLPSFAFDSSVAGIFWTLCQGGRLLMPREGFEQRLSDLPGLIAGHGVTHLLGLPSLWSVLLEHAPQAQLASLSTVVVAGETCPPVLVHNHRHKLPSTGLFNEYGPTEATVWSTVFDCATLGQRPRVPIGKPIPGAGVYVLDDALEPVPIGAAGELYIGGPGVATGYLGRPELTAERFVPDPFADNPTARLYRTGDRARLQPDGELEFLGRTDGQVKVRGYRIEVEEIEAHLRGYPELRDCAVGVQGAGSPDPRIIAWVTMPAADEPSTTDIRAFLARSLPDYMLPSHIVVLDELPLLPNGKVDRRALPEPGAERPRLREEYVAPQTPVEQVLASVWADVLDTEMVGAHDDFFELGGHSILVMRLVNSMRDVLGVNVPLAAVFAQPTVAGLAEHIRSDASDGPAAERRATLVLDVSRLTDEEVEAHAANVAGDT